ncbi:hypothetical protein [Streptomyces koyangensis]
MTPPPEGVAETHYGVAITDYDENFLALHTRDTKRAIAAVLARNRHAGFPTELADWQLRPGWLRFSPGPDGTQWAWDCTEQAPGAIPVTWYEH